MGKRKKSSRKPAAKKKMEPLATTFACLFCNHEKSVTCKLDKKHQVGVLHCKVCAQSFQTDINSLSQPIDIYSDWIDACDAVTRDHEGGGGDEYGGGDKFRRGAASGGVTGGVAQSSRGGGSSSRRAVDDEDDDDLEEYE